MTRKVDIVQIGLGGVGQAVARLMVGSSPERWRRDLGLDVGYIALVDSRSALVGSERLSEADLSSAIDAKASGGSLADMPGGSEMSAAEAIKRAAGDRTSTTVVIDCAAGDTTYDADLAAVESGCVLVLSNKAPLAVDQDRYDRLMGAGGGMVWYEATVGAGLPVVSTLRSLIATGDEIVEIAGCLSGTLGYVTSELMDDGRRYSQAVRKAKDMGYTEPDPRDDLSGIDVARKALILARTFGRRMDLSEVLVEPLLPPLDENLAVDDFMKELHVMDEDLMERVEQARRAGRTLKYVARIPAQGEATVGLVEAPTASQIGSLRGSENLVAFRTREYKHNPLTVIGPGAGQVVTAMGVLSDVLAAVRP